MPDPMSRDPEVVALMNALRQPDLGVRIREDYSTRLVRESDADLILAALHAAGYRVERDIRPLLQGEPHALPWEPLGLAAPTEEERQHE